MILVGVGRLKAGPERDIADRYIGRAIACGRPQGISVSLREVEESRARRVEDRRIEEAKSLTLMAPDNAGVCALDERGDTLDSEAFTGLVGRARDGARSALIVAIGGADGLDADYRSRADQVIAFGAMTWPHQLVRIMAAEQIYRAVSILAGHPYHRG